MQDLGIYKLKVIVKCRVDMCIYTAIPIRQLSNYATVTYILTKYCSYMRHKSQLAV